MDMRRTFDRTQIQARDATHVAQAMERIALQKSRVTTLFAFVVGLPIPQYCIYVYTYMFCDANLASVSLNAHVTTRWMLKALIAASTLRPRRADTLKSRDTGHTVTRGLQAVLQSVSKSFSLLCSLPDVEEARWGDSSS